MQETANFLLFVESEFGTELHNTVYTYAVLYFQKTFVSTLFIALISLQAQHANAHTC